MALISEQTHNQSLLEKANPLRVELVRSLEDLVPHAEAWDLMALAAPQKTPMSSHAWVSAFLEHQLQPGQGWFCLLAFKDQVLVGVLPVVVTPDRRFWGNRPILHTPENDHTHWVDFLFAPGYETLAVGPLVSALRDVEPSYTGLRLAAVSFLSPTLELMKNAVRGTFVISHLCGEGSYLRTEGSFENYHQGLSSNFRNNLRKARNKLAKLPEVRATFLTGARAKAGELGRFLMVEDAGWKGRRGTAILRSPALVPFYSALTDRLEQRGWLEWHFLETEGKTIAGQLGVRVGRVLNLLKIAYDESYAQCAPGNLLFEKTLQRAFASEDIDEINCLTDMPWHRNWRMDRRPYYDIWIYPRRPLPFLFSFLPKRARSLLREVPGIRPLVHAVCKIIRSS